MVLTDSNFVMMAALQHARDRSAPCRIPSPRVHVWLEYAFANTENPSLYLLNQNRLVGFASISRNFINAFFVGYAHQEACLLKLSDEIGKRLLRSHIQNPDYDFTNGPA